MMNLLEGKTAIITGGSRGIGKAIVEVFVKQDLPTASPVFTGTPLAKSLP